MTPSGPNANRTIDVHGLARVEGEGSLHVAVHDGVVDDVELEIFEPPRFFEAFLRRPRLRGAAGHYGADLRDLPRRLPDVRLRGNRGRLRRHGRPSRSASSGASCTAASGSRATPCTSTCSTPPTSSAAGTPSSWPREPGRRRARPAPKKDRQPPHGTGRRTGDPPRERPRRGFLPLPRARRVAAMSSRSNVPGRNRSRRSPGSPASSSPTSRRTTASWRFRTPTTTRSRRAASCPPTGSTPPPASSPTWPSRSTSPARRRCTPGCTAATLPHWTARPLRAQPGDAAQGGT